MALNSQYSAGNNNAALDARTARLVNGYLRIYSGTQPASAAAGIGAAVLLAEHRYGTPAFSAAAASLATANAIATATVLATGVATWCRSLQSDGTTVECDASAGRNGFAADGVTPSGGAVYNLNLGSASYQAGADSAIASLTLAAPLAGT